MTSWTIDRRPISLDIAAMDSLVTTDWLAAELGAADLRILDASAFLPGAGRNALAEHEAAHIPGAVFFDIDATADPGNPLPHAWPPAHVFAARMRALGIGDGDRIVIYDDSPLHSSARAWWLLRSFGAKRVAILDGGLARWRAEGRALERGPVSPRPGHFTPAPNAEAVIAKAEVLGLLGESGHAIADARSVARFTGTEAEPRPGLASGHIPGSHCLPQGAFFDADNRFKQGAGLRAVFADGGVDLAKPLVATCGSGVTACVILFAAQLLGKGDIRLYDGSWSEWGSDPAMPKARGPA